MDREIGIQAAKDYLHKKYLARELKYQNMCERVSQTFGMLLCMMVLFGMLIFS